VPKRRLQNFPEQFAQLTDRAIKAIETEAIAPGGEVLLRLDLKTQGSAINVQMQLRQYWSALTSEADDGKLDEWDPNLKRSRFVGQMAVRYSAGSKTVIEVVHRSQLKAAAALADALGTAEQPIRKQPPPAKTVPSAGATAANLDAALERATPGKAQEALIDAMFPGAAPPSGPKG
jgi:hypothetical protein